MERRVVALAACASYYIVQIAWFRRYLRRGVLAAGAYATAAIVVGLVFAFMVAWLFV